MDIKYWLVFLASFSPCLCQTGRPNIVLIITDDLDVDMGSDAPLVKTHNWINDNGVNFINSYVSVPVCCPSRSSMLTGLYQHNHGVLNNSVSGGCSSYTWQQGPERETFATYLKGAGYVTFYAGKYMNQYGYASTGGLSHVPDGWDFWAGLQGNSRYYDYVLSTNGQPELHGSDYENDYFTDVIGRKANSFLDFYFDQISPSLPFMMVLSTSAPHDPFTPAPQYENNFGGQTAPRSPAFNYIEEDAGANPKHWFVNQGPRPLDQDIVDVVDEIYRDRLRTMLSVDDMVDNVMSRLESNGVLDNTYVILTSDHGYHLGQFSMHKDKRQPYEFDTHIPLSVRGPGVRQNETESTLVSLIDLAPTIIDMGGVAIPSTIDGTSFLPFLLEGVQGNQLAGQESVLISYSGEGNPAETCLEVPKYGMGLCEASFDCKCQDSSNNTYTCVRTYSASENIIFCQFDDDASFEEFYDLSTDPYQLLNAAPELSPQDRDLYIARLESLRACRGSASCFQPVGTTYDDDAQPATAASTPARSRLADGVDRVFETVINILQYKH